MTRLLLLAGVSACCLAAPAAADTIGPGERPAWLDRCDPLETQRITQREYPALATIAAAALTVPPSTYTAPPPVIVPWRPLEPIPAAVHLPATVGLLLTALAAIWRYRK